MNPPAADEVGGAGDGEMGPGFAGLGSGSFNARKSWVNPPWAAAGFSGLDAAGAKEKSSAGFCWSRSVGKDVSCAGDAGAEENMLVNAPGSLDDGVCGAGGGAAPAAPVDWNMRVNAPGSLDDGDCGAAAGAAGAAAAEDWKSCVNSPGPVDLCGVGTAGVEGAGAGAFPESALNICVKLLGASEGCAACGPDEAAGAGSGGADAGFSIETWRKMLATPASDALGDLKVWSIRVNSPAPEEARTTGGVAGADGAADAGGTSGALGEEAGGAGADEAGGPRSDARRSSSVFCATG